MKERKKKIEGAKEEVRKEEEERKRDINMIFNELRDEVEIRRQKMIERCENFTMISEHFSHTSCSSSSFSSSLSCLTIFTFFFVSSFPSCSTNGDKHIEHNFFAFTNLFICSSCAFFPFSFPSVVDGASFPDIFFFSLRFAVFWCSTSVAFCCFVVVVEIFTGVDLN